MPSRNSAGTYQGNKLIHNSQGNVPSHLSHLAGPPWTDPGLKSGTGVCKLISTVIIINIIIIYSWLEEWN